MSGFMGLLASSSSLAILDTQTVTRGFSNSGANPAQGYTGYNSGTPAFGSISDGTSNVFSGATITALYFYEAFYDSPPSGFVTRQVVLRLGSVVTNTGFTTLLVGGTEFLRTDAAFTTGSGYSQWVWSVAIPDNFISENDPFTSTTTVKWY